LENKKEEKEKKYEIKMSLPQKKTLKIVILGDSGYVLVDNTV